MVVCKRWPCSEHHPFIPLYGIRTIWHHRMSARRWEEYETRRERTYKSQFTAMALGVNEYVSRPSHEIEQLRATGIIHYET